MSNTLILQEDLGMLYPTSTSKTKARYGIYLCHCGNIFTTQIHRVNNGYTQSCGCYNISRTISVNSTHGLCNHPLYQTWSNMVQRTTNPNSKDYAYYSSLIDPISQEWLDVGNFISDMYPLYSEGLTIDRVNNTIGYNKENCRWSSRGLQAQNTRIIRINNTSGYRGVCWHKSVKKWVAQISVNSNRVCIGYFLSAIEAAIAYNMYVTDNKLSHTKNTINVDSELTISSDWDVEEVTE